MQLCCKPQAMSIELQHKHGQLVYIKVWFSLRVREVPGSIPGLAQSFFFFLSTPWIIKTSACLSTPQVVIHAAKMGKKRGEVRVMRKRRLRSPSFLCFLTNCCQYTRPGIKQWGTCIHIVLTLCGHYALCLVSQISCMPADSKDDELCSWRSDQNWARSPGQGSRGHDAKALW